MCHLFCTHNFWLSTSAIETWALWNRVIEIKVILVRGPQDTGLQTLVSSYSTLQLELVKTPGCTGPIFWSLMKGLLFTHPYLASITSFQHTPSHLIPEFYFQVLMVCVCTYVEPENSFMETVISLHLLMSVQNGSPLSSAVANMLDPAPPAGPQATIEWGAHSICRLAFH